MEPTAQINMDERDQGQVKPWSWRAYIKASNQGWRIIFSEMYKILTLKLRLEPEKVDKTSSNQDAEQATLIYGMGIIAKLCASVYCGMAWFTIEVNAGILPSRWFSIISHLIGLIGFVLGVALAYTVFHSSVDQLLPILAEEVSDFINVIVILAEIAFVLLGNWVALWLVRKRKVMQHFILFSCSNIMATKEYQKRSAVRTFLSILLCSHLAEPLFAFMESISMEQPNFMHLSLQSFRIFKLFSIPVVSIGTSIYSNIQYVIPIITCFLSCCIAEMIETTVNRHRSKFSFHDAEFVNPTLNQSTPDKTDPVVSDFALDTLYKDWPAIRASNEFPISSAGLSESRSQDKQAFSSPIKKEENQRLSMGSTLFHYRSLIKTLSVIKVLTKKYYDAFGYIHFFVICVNAFIGSQWVVLGLLQIRISERRSQMFQSSQERTLLLRTSLTIMVFIATNSIIFMHCDRLPDQLLKLRNQLFKINLNIAKRLDSGGANKVEEDSAHRDLALAWSLYDQVTRLSREANLRLVGETHYGKHCLLFIFSRYVSFLLLYMQIIDVYSHVYA